MALSVQDIMVAYNSNATAKIIQASTVSTFHPYNDLEKKFYTFYNPVKTVRAAVGKNEEGKDGMGFFLRKFFMDSVCMLQPDVMVVLEAFEYLEHVDKSKQAAAFLFHYINGNAAEVKLNLDDFFADETLIFEYVKKQLAQRALLKQNKIDIGQQMFITPKWHNSTGSVYIYWEDQGNRIKVRLSDEYHWYSNQEERDLRTTECVHQAMNRLKKAGAMNFAITSTEVFIPVSELTRFYYDSISPRKVYA